MTQINVYLTFDGNCAEAMNFYKECLGGELTLNPIDGSGMESQCTGAKPGAIMHAELRKWNLLLMASDMMTAGTELVRGNATALSLNCSSEVEIYTFFEKLSQDGTQLSPVKKEFWGALFGMFTDKFGVRWLLNYDQSTQ